MVDKYAKIEVPYHERDVEGARVPAALMSGFCARRSLWPEGTFCFLAKGANYSAQDGVTGMLSAFLIRREGNRDKPWFPADDFKENDWELYTRQQTHHFPRQDKRPVNVDEIIEPL